MTTQTTQTLIQWPAGAAKLLQELAADTDIIEAAREPAIRTTQNSYGYYGGKLDQLAKLMPLGTLDRTGSMKFWADVLIVAGANRQGVIDALRAFT